MHWIHHYQLFLFDFDGILVNTEELHYRAYVTMCANRGFDLPWNERTYLRYAMYKASGLKEGIYAQFPQLYESEPNWDVLYEEKKQIYSELLSGNRVALMPGVQQLLNALDAAGIERCVVTNSIHAHIQTLRSFHPILNTIPHWMTREDYQEPKPSSECYLKAISCFAKKGDRVIGFEDSPKGLKALMGTAAKAVFISPYFTADEVEGNFEYATSFEHLFDCL